MTIFNKQYTRFLGYTKDDDGNLVIDPEQAEVVKRIYREYLEGYSMDSVVAFPTNHYRINTWWMPSTLKLGAYVKKANNKEAYDEIADQIFALREKRQQASMDTVQRITELQDLIKDQSSDLTVFDESLVKRQLKQITIWPTHCTVELKSGLKVDVER